MSKEIDGIDAEELKKEVKQELLKREIMMGLEEDEIDLFELGRVLLKHWKLVIIFPLVVSLLVAAYSLTLPNWYKAKATIFVHTSGGKLSSIMASIPFASMLGSSLGGGGGNSECLMAYLKSRTLTDEIINKFGVATNPMIMGPGPYNLKKLKHDDLLEKMGKIISVDNDKKTGLVTISAETLSASFSAQLAETYIGYLSKFSRGPQTEKRIFIEKRLKIAKKELSDAELKFKSFQDKNKIFALDTQAQLIVSKLTSLESEKIKSDINIKMQQSLLKSSGNMSELVELQGKKISEEAKIKALNAQIAKTEAALDLLPEQALEFAHFQRTLKVKAKIFGMLTEQYEVAKIAEAEEEGQFKVVDHAGIPDKKSKPRRSIMVILAGLSAGVLGVFGAFLIEFIRKRKIEEKESVNTAQA